MATITEKEFKSILNKYKFIDSWFWLRYGINPYHGCRFGCIYCDSRSGKYRLPIEFEDTIIVKKNIKEMLDRRLSKARTLLPDVVGVFGATDPYQPAEADYKNTRQCLEVLAKHRYPVHTVTKSKLILRDLDLLETIGGNNWCTVSVTITTADSDVARFLEKRAPSPQARFDVIKTIKERTKHVQAGVLLIPIVPVLCDSGAALEEMFQRAKAAGADYILFGGMTLRDTQALWFLKHINEKCPVLISEYEELYRFKYAPDSYEGAYAPRGDYALKLHKTLFALCDKYQIPYRIKRYIPDDFRRINYLTAEKLLNEAYRLQMTGKAWNGIFWAGQNIQNLKESVADVAKKNELQKILNVNAKIESFIRKSIGV
ncbi:MAG: radical SAM protein [Bacillota bacterium]